jgi:hypothetical protein
MNSILDESMSFIGVFATMVTDAAS